MHAIEKWYEVIKSDNPDKYDEILAEDCVFYSPVVYTPQRGREITKTYLMAAGGVFGGEDSPKKILDEKSPSKFKYIKEIIGENSAVLEFETETKSSLAVKQNTKSAKEDELAETNVDLADDMQSLTSEQALLDKAKL